MKTTLRILVTAFLFTVLCQRTASAFDAGSDSVNRRLIVLTDIENEPDDTQSMVRLLLYSNRIDIEGIVAVTSIHMYNQVRPASILKVIGAYDKVRDNLLLHESGFPTADYLRSVTASGNPSYGMDGVGEGMDSEGSDLIVNVLSKDDPRPVWIAAWGGTNALAQALWHIDRTFSKKDAARLRSKIRVYAISDQDTSGPWIRKTYPDIFYVVSPGYTYGKAAWKGISEKYPGADSTVVSDEWLARNIQQGHGSLGAVYPDVTYLMEGDTPSFLGLVSNGLNDAEHPFLGGWGGRYELYIPKFEPSDESFVDVSAYPEETVNSLQTPGSPMYPYLISEDAPETRPIWTNAADMVSVDGETVASAPATIWRWRKDFQNDFAARMDWCVKSFDQANHYPVIHLSHDTHLTVRPGQMFNLCSDSSYDPDGDSLSYEWMLYPAPEGISLPSIGASKVNMHELRLYAPMVDRATTLHFVLRVYDKGTPSMTSYVRITVEVVPDGK